MKKFFLAYWSICVLATFKELAMESIPSERLKTIGQYIDEFEARTKMVASRIKSIDSLKGPTGLDHPYFIWHGDFWERFFKKIQHDQLHALSIEKFVEKEYVLACKLTKIKPTAEPTTDEIRFVAAVLKKQLENMLEQRETELAAYRQLPAK
jgi:hypothetical protein